MRKHSEEQGQRDPTRRAEGTEARYGASATRRARPLIVVAEDEARDWELYGKILWYNGYDVLHARDGQEALDLVREHHPDLVILDLMMPKLSGIDVCRRLKRNPATEDIPAIALSARARWEMGAEARDAGCTAYLEKPIGPLSVLHAVEELIGTAPPAGEVASGEREWRTAEWH